MKLYIAGPMTGLPDFNYPAFFAAAKDLRARGYGPINPARVRSNVVKPPTTWLDFMRHSLRDIADADGIATLPGWRASRGASLEVDIARRLELPVRPVQDWITAAPKFPAVS